MATDFFSRRNYDTDQFLSNVWSSSTHLEMTAEQYIDEYPLFGSKQE